jgi:DNA helicase-2/ATP-dependent DNA helicase PcrA
MNLTDLNPHQAQAVSATEGFVRCVAGAGSGKTRTLAYRFAYLYEVLGIQPGSILTVTFTNKAANEMRNRIRSLIGDHALGFIGTFHSFCTSVLKEDSHAIGFPKSFAVIDREDLYAMLRIVYEERGLTLRDMKFSKACDMMEIIKCVENPRYIVDFVEQSTEELKRRYDHSTTVKDIIFNGCLYQQKKLYALDFNDLIISVLYIFENKPDIKLKWQQRLEYIMVDEFQDVDDLQYKLVSVLCDYHKNLMIVGDPDQTVYTWRGASVRFILDFAETFLPCRTVELSDNYRSAPGIIAAANALIEKNKKRMPKSLRAIRQGGAKPRYCHAKTAEMQARFIADEITGLIANGANHRDIAVLYRAAHISRAIEEALLQKEIPYVVYSGAAFYNRREIKDILSYLRMLTSQDDIAFERTVNVPLRGIGKTRMAFLREHAAAQNLTLFNALKDVVKHNHPLFRSTGAKDYIRLIEDFTEKAPQMTSSDLTAAILSQSGYENMLRTEGEQTRLDNLAELKQTLSAYEAEAGEAFLLDDFLAKAALMTNADEDTKKHAVRLMTVHTAKGLEFKHVFAAGWSEGIFPAKQADTIEKLEEERRLAYVAVTRARDTLTITDAEGTGLDGSYLYPSRFIFDIGRENLDYVKELPESLITEALNRIRCSQNTLIDEQSSFFAPGDRVVHPVLGLGTIWAFDAGAGVYSVKFDSSNTPRNISVKIKMVLNGDGQGAAGL